MMRLAWLLFAVGALLIGFDLARFTMSGVAVLGVVLMVIWLWLIGGFRSSFWFTDPATSARLDAVDQDLTNRGL